MRYYTTTSFSNYEMTPYVKRLIALNVGIWFFLIVIFQKHFLETPLVFNYLGLNLNLILSDYYIWQFLSYSFLHSNGIFHIFFNMFILWMFGSELEKLWGSRFFLTYYLSCALGAAFIYLICTFTYVFGFAGDLAVLSKPVIGASGAIFGLLYAYGFIYSERIIYLMGLFPIKARHFVLLIAAIELVSLLNSGFGSPIANLAHLGGIVSGFIFLKFWKVIQAFSIRRWKKLKGSVHLKILKNNDRNDTDFH